MDRRTLFLAIVAMFLLVGAVVSVALLRSKADQDELPDGIEPSVSGETPRAGSVPDVASPHAGVSQPTSTPSPTDRPGTTRRKGVLRFHVRSIEGTALSRIKASLEASDGASVYQGTLSGRKGRYSLGAVPGDYRLRIEAFRYRNQETPVFARDFNGPPLDVVLALDTRPASVSLLILDQHDQPVSSGQVVLKDGEERGKPVPLILGADQRWSAENVPAGDYGIHFSGLLDACPVMVSKMRVNPGEAWTEKIQLAMGSLQVRVVDRETGLPLVNAAVYLHPRRSKDKAIEGKPYRTDGQGIMHASVLPRDTYVVIARKAGYAMGQSRGQARPGSREPVSLSLGKTPGLSVTFDPPPAAGLVLVKVSGRNLNTPPAPLARDGSGNPILDLEPGRYELLFFLPDRRPAHVAARAESFASGAPLRVKTEAER